MEPRQHPIWVRTILNSTGPVGIWITLEGWVRPPVGWFAFIIGALYVAWELVPYVSKLRESNFPSITSPATDEEFETSQENIPNVAVQFVIDSVEGQPGEKITIHAHVSLTNHDTRTVKVIKAQTDSKNNYFYWKEPQSPSVRSGAKLSIPCGPFFYLHVFRLIDIRVDYQAVTEARIENYSCLYRFMLPAGQLSASAIDPTGLEESVGSSSQEALIRSFAGLSEPEGTMLMAIPELNDNGLANVFIIKTPTKRFEFNPARRFASFSTTGSDGHTKVIKKTLPKVAKGMQVIGLMWEIDQSIKLKVDIEDEPQS